MTRQTMNEETSSSIGFHKETIVIDVPDGYEILNDGVHSPRIEHFGINALPPGLQVKLYLKKKEPEFIEVRDYLSKCHDGTLIKMTLNSYEFDIAKGIESQSTFIRWIDNEPRKVQI